VGTTERRVLKELGSRIRAAREAAGFTQEAVAARCGIDYKRYQRLEQGAVNTTIRTLLRVARAMDMDFWGLLVGAGGRARGE